MSQELTPEFIIQLVRLTTGIVFTWPLSSKITRRRRIILQISWCFFFIVIATNVLLLISKVYKHRSNFYEFTENICLALSMMQIALGMLVAKYHHHRFQHLIEEMQAFVRNANSHERQVLVDYAKRVSPFYLRYLIFSLSTTLVYLIIVFILEKPSPHTVDFSFSIDGHPIYDIIFLFEALAAVQCFCNSGFICSLCLLLWHGTIQLALLAERVELVSSRQELAECVSLHQHILWYVRESIEIVRLTVAYIIAISTIAIACGSIHVVGTVSFFKRVQFASIQIAFGLDLLCITWAAENLTAASNKVGWALYKLSTETSRDLKKSLIFMILKCQNSPKIAINGLLSNLSLEYYAKYMSAIYSFFTALRIFLQKIEKN